MKSQHPGMVTDEAAFMREHLPPEGARLAELVRQMGVQENRLGARQSRSVNLLGDFMPRAVFSCALGVCAAAGLLAGLVACGGGGSGSTSTSGTGDEGGLVVYSRGSMSSSDVPLGTDNAFELEGVRYTLRTGEADCTVGARPASERPAACAPLPGGEAFLACDSGNVVRLVLLRPDAFQEVSWARVNRRTLTKVTCSATGLQQIAGSTVTFRGFPGSAKERHVTDGGATVTGVDYSSDNLMKLFSDSGNFGGSTLVRHRWILYKSAVGTSTLYVLVDAYEGSFPPAPAVYVVQVP